MDQLQVSTPDQQCGGSSGAVLWDRQAGGRNAPEPLEYSQAVGAEWGSPASELAKHSPTQLTAAQISASGRCDAPLTTSEQKRMAIRAQARSPPPYKAERRAQREA